MEAGSIIAITIATVNWTVKTAITFSERGEDLHNLALEAKRLCHALQFAHDVRSRSRSRSACRSDPDLIASRTALLEAEQDAWKLLGTLGRRVIVKKLRGRRPKDLARYLHASGLVKAMPEKLIKARTLVETKTRELRPNGRVVLEAKEEGDVVDGTVSWLGGWSGGLMKEEGDDEEEEDEEEEDEEEEDEEEEDEEEEDEEEEDEGGESQRVEDVLDDLLSNAKTAAEYANAILAEFGCEE